MLSASNRFGYFKNMTWWNSFHVARTVLTTVAVTFCLALQLSNANASVIHMKVSPKLSLQEKGHVFLPKGDVYKHFEHEGRHQSSDLSFSLAKVFQDHMVLQRAPSRARVFGFSPNIGSKVIIQMHAPNKDYYYTTYVTDGPQPGVGNWAVSLDPMNITDPVQLKFISEESTLTLSDVLFGDVWLCSGQSNMQFTVLQGFDGDQELLDSVNYPNIRLLQLTKVQSSTPLYDVSKLDLDWSLPSPKTLSSNKPWTYFSSVCWLYGKHIYQAIKYPVGLVATNWGGTPIEAWSSPEALKVCYPDKGKQPLKQAMVDSLNGPSKNSVLWNSMVHPLLGMTIYGSIWYQGESDSNQKKTRDRYNCTFPTMIKDWREKFNKESSKETNKNFPFGFVQLAPDHEGKNQTIGFSDIRWHQTADIGYVPNSIMPNTFMAVAMDLPDFKSIYASVHPRDKEDVGYRLALGGLAIAYKRKEHFQGPFPVKGHYIAPSTVILDYGTQWTLNIKTLNGFEVYCRNGSTPIAWYPVDIVSYNTTTLIFDLSHNKVCVETVPQAMRYAWLESPCGFKSCAVYATVNDLPAPPFYAQFSSTMNGHLELGFQ